MLPRINKKIIITGVFLCAIAFTGCSFSSGITPDPDIRSPYNTADNSYRQRFISCVRLIGEYDYSGAESALKELIDDLDKEYDDDITAVRADADYALGRVYSMKGYDGKAYDHYNSAYVYYRDIYGEEAPRTVDARLCMADYGYILKNLKDIIAVEGSGADALFKDIALSRAMRKHLSLDNKQEVMSRLDRVIAFAKDKTQTTGDEESAALLYGEDADITFTLGRRTKADIYRDACFALAEYYDVIGQAEESEKIYEELLTSLTGDDLKTKEEKFKVYDYLADIKLYYDGVAEENEYIEKALEAVKEIYTDGSRLAGEYITIAEKYKTMGDYEAFYQYLMKAYDAIGTENVENNSTVALINLGLASYYTLKSNIKMAAECARKAVDIYEARVEDDTSSIASAYNRIANYYNASGEYDKVQDYYEKSANLYKDKGMDLEYAVTQRNRALATNSTFGNHSEAMQYARKAISVVEGLDPASSGKTIAAIYMVMADIVQRGDPEYSKIEEYSEKAYACLQNAVGNTDEYYANYHYNLGNYLKDNSRYGEAIQHLIEAEAYFQKIYDETWQYPVDVLYDLGFCYYMKGDHDNAKEFFVKAVDYENERIKNTNMSEQCSYLAQNRDNAERYISYIDSFLNNKNE